MLWSKEFNCYTGNGSVLGCSSWHSLNPHALIQKWIFFHLSLFIVVNSFQHIKHLFEMLFTWPKPSCIFFNSSDTIPVLSAVYSSWLWKLLKRTSWTDSSLLLTVPPHKPQQLWSSHLNAILRVDLIYPPCLSPLSYVVRIILRLLILIV